MEPLDFMAAVLPSQGNGRYCVAELTQKKEHYYVETLEQAKTKIDEWRNKKYDIYFALGTFGIEAFQTRNGTWVEYLNTGDTYAPTIVRMNGHYRIASWGDIAESQGSL